MIGDWAMARQWPAGVCSLTLTKTEATPDNLQVFLNQNAPRRSPVSRPRCGG
jgi:hypothetical protein